MKNHKITEKEFKRLYSKNITFNEQEIILKKIKIRFDYIMKLLVPEGDEYSYGSYDEEFDEEEFSRFISFDYESEDTEESDNWIEELINDLGTRPSDYYDSFPTNWLWEDFEEKLKKELIKHNSKIKELKDKKIVLEKSILSKLNDEELKYLGFSRKKGKLIRYYDPDTEEDER